MYDTVYTRILVENYGLEEGLSCYQTKRHHV